MNEIKSGDCVVLKSGGPLMTVKNVKDTSNDGAGAVCIWFDDHSQPQQKVFSIVTLKRNSFLAGAGISREL